MYAHEYVLYAIRYPESGGPTDSSFQARRNTCRCWGVYYLYASLFLHSQEFTVEITIPSLSPAGDRANSELILPRQQSLKYQHLSTLPPQELPWRKPTLGDDYHIIMSHLPQMFPTNGRVPT